MIIEKVMKSPVRLFPKSREEVKNTANNKNTINRLITKSEEGLTKKKSRIHTVHKKSVITRVGR